MLESAHQFVIPPEASFSTSKVWDVKQLWMVEFQCVACMLEALRMSSNDWKKGSYWGSAVLCSKGDSALHAVNTACLLMQSRCLPQRIDTSACWGSAQESSTLCAELPRLSMLGKEDPAHLQPSPGANHVSWICAVPSTHRSD